MPFSNYQTHENGCARIHENETCDLNFKSVHAKHLDTIPDEKFRRNHCATKLCRKQIIRRHAAPTIKAILKNASLIDQNHSFSRTPRGGFGGFSCQRPKILRARKTEPSGSLSSLRSERRTEWRLSRAVPNPVIKNHSTENRVTPSHDGADGKSQLSPLNRLHSSRRRFIRGDELGLGNEFTRLPSSNSRERNFPDLSFPKWCD